MNKKLRFILSVITAASLTAGLVPSAVPVPQMDAPSLTANAVEAENGYSFKSQLKTPLEVNIYNVLSEMKNNGDFIRGTARIELDGAGSNKGLHERKRHAYTGIPECPRRFYV